MLPPACSALGALSTLNAATAGFPCASDQYAVVTPARKRIPIAANIAQPWRSSWTMRPKTLVSAAPIEKIVISWIRLVSGVGFS